MGVRHFQELAAWQLIDELRQKIIALAARDPVRSDFKFCSQIRDAVGSAARNTSEGFDRFRPTENLRFLEFARGSLGETQDCLLEAREKGYVDDRAFHDLWRLSKRAIGANTNYQAYLRRCIRQREKRGRER